MLITGEADMKMKLDSSGTTLDNSFHGRFIRLGLIDVLGYGNLPYILAPRTVVKNDNARDRLPVKINIRCCGHAPWGAILSERTPRVNGEVLF